jgi:hypothetical protein
MKLIGADKDFQTEKTRSAFIFTRTFRYLDDDYVEKTGFFRDIVDNSCVTSKPGWFNENGVDISARTSSSRFFDDEPSRWGAFSLPSNSKEAAERLARSYVKFARFNDMYDPSLLGDYSVTVGAKAVSVSRKLKYWKPTATGFKVLPSFTVFKLKVEMGSNRIVDIVHRTSDGVELARISGDDFAAVHHHANVPLKAPINFNLGATRPVLVGEPSGPGNPERVMSGASSGPSDTTQTNNGATAPERIVHRNNLTASSAPTYQASPEELAPFNVGSVEEMVDRLNAHLLEISDTPVLASTPTNKKAFDRVAYRWHCVEVPDVLAKPVRTSGLRR